MKIIRSPGYFIKKMRSAEDPPVSRLSCPSTPISCRSITWEGVPPVSHMILGHGTRVLYIRFFIWHVPVLFPDILPITGTNDRKKKTVWLQENKKTEVLLKFDEYNAGCHELSWVHSTQLNSWQPVLYSYSTHRHLNHVRSWNHWSMWDSFMERVQSPTLNFLVVVMIVLYFTHNSLTYTHQNVTTRIRDVVRHVTVCREFSTQRQG